MYNVGGHNVCTAQACMLNHFNDINACILLSMLIMRCTLLCACVCCVCIACMHGLMYFCLALPNILVCSQKSLSP